MWGLQLDSLSRRSVSFISDLVLPEGWAMLANEGQIISVIELQSCPLPYIELLTFAQKVLQASIWAMRAHRFYLCLFLNLASTGVVSPPPPLQKNTGKTFS